MARRKRVNKMHPGNGVFFGLSGCGLGKKNYNCKTYLNQMQMNVDLKSVLNSVHESFPEAIVSGDVVTLVKPEISWQDLQAIHKIVIGNNRAEPWFFRSGKSVKVVFFVRKKDKENALSGAESTSKSNNIIMEKVMKSRDVKSMRKDWQYGGRNFWTVVQWTDAGLAYVIVNRAPSRVAGTPDEEVVMKTVSSSLRRDQVPDAINHTEQEAIKAFNGENDDVFQELQGLGFEAGEHVVDTNPLPHFAAFYDHNDRCVANGGWLPDDAPRAKYYPDHGTFTDAELRKEK